MVNATVKTYSSPEINRKEILRYAGCKASSTYIDEIIDTCIEKAEKKITYKVCFSRFPIVIKDGEADLGFTKTSSQNLIKNLNGCNEIVLFAATLGTEFECLLRKTSFISDSKALLLQALGDERIESLCDKFNDEIKSEAKKSGKDTKPRFSPGYGDLPLSIQKDIMTALNCSTNLGISLDKSLLMTPSKSVTAIIGIQNMKG